MKTRTFPVIIVAVTTAFVYLPSAFSLSLPPTPTPPPPPTASAPIPNPAESAGALISWILSDMHYVGHTKNASRAELIAHSKALEACFPLQSPAPVVTLNQLGSFQSKAQSLYSAYHSARANAVKSATLNNIVILRQQALQQIYDAIVYAGRGTETLEIKAAIFALGARYGATIVPKSTPPSNLSSGDSDRIVSKALSLLGAFNTIFPPIMDAVPYVDFSGVGDDYKFLTGLKVAVPVQAPQTLNLKDIGTAPTMGPVIATPQDRPVNQTDIGTAPQLPPTSSSILVPKNKVPPVQVNVLQ
jgi:hypothetical protein